MKLRQMANYLSEEEMERFKLAKFEEVVLMEIVRNVGKLNGKGEIMIYLITMLDEVGKTITELTNLANTNKDYDDRVASDGLNLDGEIIDNLVEQMLGGGK